MSYTTSQTWRGRIEVIDPVTQLPANADSLPAVTMEVNGGDVADVVSVSAVVTGQYEVSASLAARAVGDVVVLYGEIVVDGVTYPISWPAFRVQQAELTESGVRGAVGLAAANLDAQLATKATAIALTNYESATATNFASLAASLLTRASATELAAVKTAALAVQGKLPASGRNMAGAGDTATNLDEVEGGGESQPRINKRFGPGVRTETSRRADGSVVAAKRLVIGAGNLPAHRCDMAPVYGEGVNVQTVSAPTVTPSGELTATALGPQDEGACVQLGGTPIVGTVYRIDAAVVMDTGDPDVASWYVECVDRPDG